MGINGVWINGKHSWKHYQLWLAKRPQIATAEPKLKLVEIPGADSELDYTEAIDGTVKYNNRQILIEFTAIRDVDRQAETIAMLRRDWHGKMLQIEFDEERGWIYSGRGSVDINDRTPNVMHISLSVLAEPFATAKEPYELDLQITKPIGTSSYSFITIPHQYHAKDEARDSLFQFSYGVNPYQDFSFFTVLNANWNPVKLRQTRNPSVTMTIKDIDGNFYSKSVGYSGGNISMTLGLATDAGVDLTKVWLIRVQNAPGISVKFGRQFCGETIIYNAGPVIFPEFSKSSNVPLQFYCNGKFTFSSSQSSAASSVRHSGTDLMLLPGENQVLITYTGDELASWSWARMWYYPKRL